MKHLTLGGLLPAAFAVATSFSMGMPVGEFAGEPLQSEVKKPTSDDQKNNKADTELTAQIRSSTMEDKTLSTAAHNVKIITQDGKVTVRGAVNTQAEKDTILAKAREIAGQDNVTDNLKVQPKKAS
jgi:hyperosmotically inducible protein